MVRAISECGDIRLCPSLVVASLVLSRYSFPISSSPSPSQHTRATTPQFSDRVVEIPSLSAQISDHEICTRVRAKPVLRNIPQKPVQMPATFRSSHDLAHRSLARLRNARSARPNLERIQHFAPTTCANEHSTTPSGFPSGRCIPHRLPAQRALPRATPQEHSLHLQAHREGGVSWCGDAHLQVAAHRPPLGWQPPAPPVHISAAGPCHRRTPVPDQRIARQHRDSSSNGIQTGSSPSALTGLDPCSSTWPRHRPPLPEGRVVRQLPHLRAEPRPLGLVGSLQHPHCEEAIANAS